LVNMLKILERLGLISAYSKFQRKFGIRKLKNFATIFTHNHSDHIFLTPDPQTLSVWEMKLAETSRAV
jgi:hypothetical protein